MSAEVGQFEAEVLAALRQLGEQQRATNEQLRELRIEQGLLRTQTNASLTGLGSRMVAVEDLARDSARRISLVEQQSAEALGRATGAERAAETWTGWPLRVLAGAAVAAALAAVVVAVVVALIWVGA